jgi:eukaryotic-like serine/threonine-protein kinase
MNARDPRDKKSSDDELTVSELTVAGLADTTPAPTSDVTIDHVGDSGSKSPSFIPLTGEHAATQALNSKNSGETANFSVDETGAFVVKDPSTTQTYRQSSAAKKVVIPGYKILGELGRGAMGVVYKAHQELADRTVALKVMLNLDHAREAEIARFKVEAQAAARLEHPNIIHVFDVGQEGELPYFTLEFVEGGTLASKISKQMLTIDQSAKMLHTLATAIAYAHSREVIHRDLKPANILLTHDGKPKIADFGLARRTDDVSHLTVDGTILGTPNYMSPEQAAGEQEVIGPLSDVYTLGAIFYELLVGRPPFKAATGWEVIQQVRSAEPTPPTTLQPGIPRDLETICLKCLQKAPDKRYGSAQLLADDLQRFLNNEPILARPIGQLERIVRLCRRYPREARLLGLIATLLLLMTGGAVATAYRINSDRERISQQVDQISKQRDEITVEKKLSDDRLTTYRQTVSKLVNNVPNILEGAPLGTGTRQEFLGLMKQILDGSEDAEAVGPSKQWGREAVAIREGEILLAQAHADRGRSDRADQVAELYSQAATKFAEAQQIAQEVLDSHPADMSKAAANLANAISRVANTATLRNTPWTEVVPIHKRAKELRREALAAEKDNKPGIALRKAELAAELNRYADFLLTINGTDTLRFANGAMENIREAIELLESSIAELPPGENNQITARRDLASSFGTLARAAERIGKDDQAEYGYSQSAEVMRKLADDFPNRFSFRKRSLEATNAYGDHLMRKNADPSKLRLQYQLGLGDLKSTLDTPEMYSLQHGQNGMAMQYYRLGIADLRLGDPAQAKMDFERSALLREIAWRETMQNLSKQQGESQLDSTISQRIELMLAQARCGNTNSALQHAKWLRERAESLVKEGQDARAGGAKAMDLFLHVASTYGISSEHLSVTERTKAINAALKAIKRSIETGYQDLNYLLYDPDLEPLQKLDEYQKLVATLKEQ